MTKRVGMRSLKGRFFNRQEVPTMEDALVTGTEVMESGTYPISDGERAAIGEVTLVVYGWENVQPGTLSWVFPSFEAAMKAARALRNATRWAIMGGRDASGAVLAERSA